jgi:GntR family transcriptional regulator
MPELNRQKPLHLQLSDYYAEAIASGSYETGQRLPSIKQIADDWGVSQPTAWRAIQHLQSARLVTADPSGTYVGDRRLVVGPQQRLKLTTFPPGERTDVLAAELVTAPEYIVPILGLEPVRNNTYHVIRREQVTYEAGNKPFMLSVSWFPPRFADSVPELLHLQPVSPAGAAKLIEQRTGQRITRGKMSREARRIKEDGREGPLLRLRKGTPVLAEVYVWMDDQDVIEYGEYCLTMDHVTENDFTAD